MLFRSQLAVEAPVVRITAGMEVVHRKYFGHRPGGPREVVALERDWVRGRGYAWNAWCIPDGLDALPGEVGFGCPEKPAGLSFLAVRGWVVEGEVVGAWCLLISPVEGSPGVYRRIGVGYVSDMESLAPALANPEHITLI